MAILRLVCCILFALVAGGCGQTVKETLYVPKNAPAGLACPKTVVVLPFADYFYGDDLRAGLIRNSMVMEYLVDQLVAKGVNVPVQDDVLQYLVDKDIVTLLPQDGELPPSNTRSLSNELSGDWSDLMKGEMRRILALEAGRTKLTNEQLLEGPGLYSLTENAVHDLGKFFQADYLVRGRIIEYYLKEGNSSGYVWDPSQAVVQLRVWVQNTATGEVVWTNRVEVKVAPKSDLTVDTNALFETALNRAATTLINDFWARVNT
jgi:hypothetical protein